MSVLVDNPSKYCLYFELNLFDEKRIIKGIKPISNSDYLNLNQLIENNQLSEVAEFVQQRFFRFVELKNFKFQNFEIRPLRFD